MLAKLRLHIKPVRLIAKERFDVSIGNIGNIFIILIVFLFSACTPKTTGEYLQEAALMQKQGDFKTAIIELKNALKNNPSSSEARVRLGKIYYLLGQFANAEKEFRNAQELSVSANVFLPLLVKSMYYQNDFGRAFLLSKDVANLNEITSSNVRLFHYLSSLRDDSIESPLAPPERLLGDDKILAIGYSELAKKKPSEAAAVLDQFTDSGHEPVEKAMLAALVYTALAKTQMAIAEYQKIIEVLPNYHIVSFQLAELYIHSELLDKAQERLDYLLYINPKSALANYLKSKINFKKDDFSSALINSELSIQAGFSNTEVYFIAGVSAYKLEKIETSRLYLMKIRNNIPSTHIANKILAEVNMKLGYTDAVIEQIENLELDETYRASLLSSAAIQQFQSGDFSKAVEYISKANQFDPGNAANLLIEGFIKLSSNDPSGLNVLSEAIEYDQSIDEAWLLSAEAHLRNGDPRAALEIAKSWQQVNLEDGMSLEGYILLQTNKIKEAKNIFEDILSLNTEHTGATRYLMLINARQENFVKAHILSTKLVEKNPELLSNILSYINIAIAQEKVTEVENYLGILINKEPSIQAPIIGLALLNSWKKNPKEALLILETKADATDPQVMRVKGDIYKSRGLLDDALSEYHSWTELYPLDSAAWFKKIELLGQQNKPSLALQATNDVLQVFPNEPRFRALNSEFLAKTGKVTEAREQFSTIKDYQSILPGLKRFNGIIAYNEKDYDEAKRLLFEYYELAPSFEIAKILAYSMQELGEASQGGELLEKALTKFPTNYRDIHTLAEYYSANNFLEKSANIYQSLLVEFPQEYITTNNYASLLIKMGKLDKAEELAAAALRLRPRSGYSLDTYGWVLFKQGKTQEALTYINMANEKLPNNMEIQLHLAEILILMGDSDTARDILVKLKPESTLHNNVLSKLKSKLNILNEKF